MGYVGVGLRWGWVTLGLCPKTRQKTEFSGLSTWMDCFAIHLFFPSSNRREAEKGCREQVPCWGMGRRPITPPRWIASQSIPLPLLQTAAKRRWESEGQSSLRRGLGRQPHRPPSFPPCHSMRTFRPSIIAARALRENASNCLSVICSIRLSGFTEPAAVVLAVGTP